MTRILRGEGDGHDLRVGVVSSRFNETITGALREGARRALLGAGISEENCVFVEVPGAIEIPLAARLLARSDVEIEAIVALGAVIRGESAHFDYVCQYVTEGCLRISLDEDLPVAFGVLTTDDEDQALARCRPDDSNKGYEAAQVAVEMALLQRRLSS